MNKRDFAKAILDKNLETFIVFIVVLKTTEIVNITIQPF